MTVNGIRLLATATLVALSATAAVCAQTESATSATATAGSGGSLSELKFLAGILTRPESTMAMRQEAAGLLLKRESPEATAALVEAMERTDVADLPMAVLVAMAAQANPPTELLPGLYKLSANESLAAPVRDAVSAALGAYHDHDVLAKMIEQVNADGPAAPRIVLIKALGHTGEKMAIEPLIMLLKSDDASIRAAAAGSLSMIALVDFGDSPEKWVEWWNEHSSDPREKWLAERVRIQESLLKRQQATLQLVTRRLVEVYQASLQGLPAKDRQPRVLKLMEDSLPEVRRLGASEAKRLLVETKQPDPALADRLVALASDESDAVRAEAAAALAVSQDKRAAETLLKRLSEESSPAIVASLIDALGDLREGQAVAPLAGLLASGNETLVIRAAGALGQIGERGSPSAEAIGPAIEPLGRLIQTSDDGLTPSAAVREAAIRAVAKIARPANMPVLLKALDDAAPTVRFFAAQGIGNIGQDGPETLKALLGHLADTDKGVRAAVCNTLGKIADHQVSGDLAARLSPNGGETDPEIRAALWNALVAIEKRTSDPRTIEALADGFDVSGNAASAAGVVQLYEAAIAKLPAENGTDYSEQLRMKLATAYDRAGQPMKAAAVLRELMDKARNGAARNDLQQRLGLVLLNTPSYGEGAALLAKASAKGDAATRDRLTGEILKKAAQLAGSGNPSEVVAMLATVRLPLGTNWGGAQDAANLEALWQKATGDLFTQSLEGMRADDAAARGKALDGAKTAVKARPELLVDSLAAELESGETDGERLASLESLLPTAREDTSAYRAAKTRQEKLKIVRQWQKPAEASKPAEKPAETATKPKPAEKPAETASAPESASAATAKASETAESAVPAEK